MYLYTILYISIYLQPAAGRHPPDLLLHAQQHGRAAGGGDFMLYDTIGYDTIGHDNIRPNRTCEL